MEGSRSIADDGGARRYKALVPRRRLVRKQSLGGVESICGSTGARWEHEIRRSGVARRVVVTVSGPKGVVDAAADRLRSWAGTFTDATGG